MLDRDADCWAGRSPYPLMPADAGIQALIYGSEEMESPLARE
jgi:hypothetical protein